jgi:hypothetical protein
MIIQTPNFRISFRILYLVVKWDILPSILKTNREYMIERQIHYLSISDDHLFICPYFSVCMYIRKEIKRKQSKKRIRREEEKKRKRKGKRRGGEARQGEARRRGEGRGGEGRGGEGRQSCCSLCITRV